MHTVTQKYWGLQCDENKWCTENFKWSFQASSVKRKASSAILDRCWDAWGSIELKLSNNCPFVSAGYVSYVSGQLKAVAKKFYRKDVDIEVLSHAIIGSRVHVVFDIQFDNEEFLKLQTVPSTSFLLDRSMMKIRSNLFFQMFPFHIGDRK